MATQIITNLAVEVDGEGPAIVCVHGLGGSSNTWTPLLPVMQGYRVVRIDLPGSGRSASTNSVLSIAQMVEAVTTVCQHLDIASAHFIGHSMGTIVCQHVATRHPQLVRSLALFGPLACPPDVARPNIIARAAKAGSGGLPAMQEIADAIVAAATSHETRAEQPAAVALVRESVMRQSPQGYAQSCLALASAQSAALERIEVPTLLVTGDQDGVAPVKAVQEMAARIPFSRMVVLAGCGHWPTFEKPAHCGAELNSFLRMAA
jgi:3-oxoadipate enol-lactonase